MALFRNQGPGGQVPPDGRPAQAPGVGKNSKRHDMERPATPGLHGSDLQYGDVSRLENAQRVAPIKQQGPGQPPPQAGGGGGAPFNMQVPDPMQFLTGRLKGTMSGPPVDLTQPGTNYMPMLRAFANAPRGSGALRHAYVTKLGEQLQRSAVPSARVIDLDALDAKLEEYARGLGE